jgi:hypothetical protein
VRLLLQLLGLAEAGAELEGDHHCERTNVDLL